ncbi:MAG: AI-2E family transporter [Patescibacteria group bacterium]
MNGQQRHISVDTSSILKTLAILFALYVLYLIRGIVALVFAALFLAALIHPIADWLGRRRIPRGVTVVLLYLGMFGLAAVTLGLLLPPLIDQSSVLVSTLGKSLQMVSGGVEWLREISVKNGLALNLQSGFQSVQTQLTSVAGGFFSTLTDIFGGIAGLIVVLVMAFYMVVQEKEARSIFHNFVPQEYQGIFSGIFNRVEEKLGHWMLGQIALCVIIGSLYYVGLRLVGLDEALVLALFGGFTEFIPYLGPIMGAIPAVLLALTYSPLKALIVLVIIIGIQQLESQIIVPKLMQRVVGLNPLISILALLIGYQLFGLVGALTAIPIATAISVILVELYRNRQALRRAAKA